MLILLPFLLPPANKDRPVRNQNRKSRRNARKSANGTKRMLRKASITTTRLSLCSKKQKAVPKLFTSTRSESNYNLTRKLKKH